MKRGEVPIVLVEWLSVLPVMAEVGNRGEQEAHAVEYSSGVSQ